MKNFLIIIVIAFNLNISAQTENYIGDYERLNETKKGEILKWTLSLHVDGTFLYNFYRNLNCASCSEENFYGKGTWETKNKLVFFYADGNVDVDETHAVNFNNTKARITSKSSRYKSDRTIKTSIRFYSSEARAIKGLELFKNN